jgi:ubiquinone biosynthesis protein COQ9
MFIDKSKTIILIVRRKLSAGVVNVLHLLAIIYASTLNLCAANAMLNDVWVIGQNQDVWCDSNQIIKDASFYDGRQFINTVYIETCLTIYLNSKSSLTRMLGRVMTLKQH